MMMESAILQYGKILLLAAAIAAPTAASALTVIGGNTRVAFGSLIAGLNLGLTGNASLAGGMSGLTVNFPITGGTLNSSLSGQILHAGSGISLGNGTNVLALRNFTINTATQMLMGDAALNGALLGTNLNLFSFNLGSVSVAQLTSLMNPLLTLTVTPTASGALTAAFGLGSTTGATIGTAATAPAIAAVPEPASWILLMAGFAMVGTAVRRRPTFTAVAA